MTDRPYSGAIAVGQAFDWGDLGACTVVANPQGVGEALVFQNAAGMIFQVGEAYWRRMARQRETPAMTDRPSPDELAALRCAKGGRSTVTGTADHQLFERMAAKGWVKEATLTGSGVAWRLAGDGLTFAYAEAKPPQ